MNAILDKSLTGTAVDLQTAQRLLSKTCTANVQAYRDWYAQRKESTHLGASEIGALLGLSPWVTRHQLWRRKHGHEGPSPTSSRMEYGTHMEPLVLHWLSQQLPQDDKLVITSTRDYVVHCRHPLLDWATCSPDALIQRANGSLALVEVKTTQQASDVALWDALGATPDTTQPNKLASYWFQVVWQQIVCRVFETVVAIAHGTDLHVYTVRTTPEVRKLVGETIRAEWERVLRDRREPHALAPDLSALAKMYPPEVSDPAPRLEDDELVRLVEEWDALRAQTSALDASKRPLEERRKNIQARIAQAMGREGLVYVGEYEVKRTVTTVTPEPYLRQEVRLAPRKPGPPAARVEERPAAELYPVPDLDALHAYLSERPDGETRSALAKVCAPGVLDTVDEDPRFASPRKGRLCAIQG